MTSTPPPPTRRRLPPRLIVVAGTYDGVLAGWDTVSHNENDKSNVDAASLLQEKNNDDGYLKLSFAMAAHGGSVRSLNISSLPGSTASSLGMGGGKNKNDDEDEAGGIDHENENDDGDGAGVEGTSKKKKKRRRKDKAQDTSSAPPSPEAQSLSIQPGTLLTTSYDSSVLVHSLLSHRTTGEFRTPSDLGSPLCSAFAPPTLNPTHALIGLSSGKILLYKKSDWTVQHILSGHDDRGVNCLSVHPSGKLALSGGRDGKIILWDLTRGKLSYVHKLPPSGKGRGGRPADVGSLVFSEDGLRYGYCHGTHVTVKDVTTGEELLDVDLPRRANDLCFVGPGPEGMFVAVACDDGSLPLLAVDGDGESRKAIMAIEPVEGLVAGEARFKCVRRVLGGSGFLVVTANSGGVLSLVDLEGGVRMMLMGDDEEEEDGEDEDERAERRRGLSGEDGGTDDDDDEEEDLAAEILESVRVGSGARITNMAVWSWDDSEGNDEEAGSAATPELQEREFNEEIDVVDDVAESDDEEKDTTNKGKEKNTGIKRKALDGGKDVEMDAEAVERARELVSQAKKRQKRKERKKSKKKGKMGEK